ncbi:hypothetical protein JW758_04735 [Candidatus Peregrinibacteria bacterium]|nr:hypothetical protein [Candidatus Peregrinibacteria bacterium]
MGFDAFKATNEAVAVNKEAFAKDGEIGQSAEDELNKVQGELNKVTKKLKSDLNKNEIKLATLAIERELENEMPDDFKMYYDRAKDWTEAASEITSSVLSRVQNFVTGRLEKVVSIVDEESWTDNLDKGEVEDVLKELDPNISSAEIEQLYSKWSGKKTDALTKGKNAALALGSRYEQDMAYINQNK